MQSNNLFILVKRRCV